MALFRCHSNLCFNDGFLVIDICKSLMVVFVEDDVILICVLMMVP